MIKLRYKFLVGGISIGAALLWLHFKHPITGVTLHPGRTAEDSLHLPDYGHGNIITVKKIGNKTTTTITPKIMGFPFDIGASCAFGGNNTELYLTTEIFYYRHMEILAGAGITYPIVHPRAMIAVGYRLPWKRVDNISLFVGHDTQNIIMGVYGRFGSN